MPNNIDHNGINLIYYPREVEVDGEVIDTAGLIYEEDPISFAGKSGNHTLKIYITTDFIKKYIDHKMKYSDGEFTFRVNNNTITLTENNVSVENELFGTIYECEITAFYCSETLIVHAYDINKIIGMSVFSYDRKNADDNYMRACDLRFYTDAIGELYTDLTYDDSYHYYITRKFERKKPEGKVVGVNLRGNYIYQNENGGYFIESNGVYYKICTEQAITLDNE